MTSIAYFGPPGTFTEQAARALAGDGDELVPAETVPAALAAVGDGEADAACVPIENSVEGAVTATMDALAGGAPLVAVAETVLPVRFSVLARHGVTADEVRTVASHPHALAQVRDWLAEHLPKASTLAATSTAAAAVGVVNGEFDAAITAPVAAAHYRLDVLATEVADVADAVTRFLLLRKPFTPPEPTGFDRTSVVAVAEDRVGALSELLVELSSRGINMSRIESRPIRGRFGEYRFFFDFDGHIAQPRVADALAALHRRCRSVRFLGSYPRCPYPGDAPMSSQPPSSQPPSSQPRADATARAYAKSQRWIDAVRAGETS